MYFLEFQCSKPMPWLRAIECRRRKLGSLVELVEQQPATRCVVGSIPAGSALEVWPWTSIPGSIPAGSALEVWPWTSVLNSLVD
jgi:hypothetical protein